MNDEKKVWMETYTFRLLLGVHGFWTLVALLFGSSWLVWGVTFATCAGVGAYLFELARPYLMEKWEEYKAKKEGEVDEQA